MSEFAIRVDSLSKSFRIRHLHRERLREALEERLRRRWSTLWRGVGRRRPKGPAMQEMETIWALKDVSLEIRHGEVVGLVGHNGAGKSVLLKILARVISPTKGRAEIYGRVGALLEVGTGFHSELTGRENIYLSGTILGMRRSEIERKFDEIVAFSGVEKFLDTPVKRYSSGMRVRLGFAVAAHLEPEILLIDEVLAVGDRSFVDKCIHRMNDIARDGGTLIIVSHQMQTIERLCSRVFLFQHGALIHGGPCKEIIERYTATAGDSTGNPATRYPRAVSD